MSERPRQSGDRADRILDAAGELLLRHGYRKVTIEDIARHAGIGKGTVYLHWRTKELLFDGVLLRESIALTEEFVQILRQDPTEVTPHRLVRTSFVATNRRPLIRALVTKDTELLGKLHDESLRSQELLASEQFFDVLVRHGLLRDDVPNLPYALQAAVTGFYLFDLVHADLTELDLSAKADALAHTVRHAFEPAAQPERAALVSAASELVTLFDDLIATYRKWVYAHDPTSTGKN